MIKQEINLYKLLPQRPMVHLTLEILTFWYIVFFLVLMLQYANGTWKKHELANQLILAETAYQQQEKRMSDIGRKYGALDPHDLQGTLLQLQKNLKLHSSMLTQLFEQPLLSSYLQAFAQSTTSGVWLTEFNITHRGEKIDLKGHALEAIQVERFRSQLQAQSVFSKMVFVLQDVTQPSGSVTDKKYIDFYITTKEVVPNVS